MIAHEFWRGIAALTGWDESDCGNSVCAVLIGNIGASGTLQDVGRCFFPCQVLSKARRICGPEELVDGGAAKIGVDEQDRPLIVACETYREISSHKCLALGRHAAAYHDCF